MDNIGLTAVVLASLEHLPAEPSDLTGLLLDVEARAFLLQSIDAPISSGSYHPDASTAGLRPSSKRHVALAQYLAATVHHSRIDHWMKVLEHPAGESPYQTLVAGSIDYPRLLLETPEAPPVLFTRGTEAIPAGGAELTLAVIGSRATSNEVLAATYKIAYAVAGEGVRVISGLASGVDSAAHRGALDAGGMTTAVMGTGIERIYPDRNIDLAKAIDRSGTLMSQFAPAAPATPTTFLHRNRVIAGLSGASLIMDGSEESGSRHEIEQAIRYGRPVFLWRPSLGSVLWAQDLATRGVANYVDSATEISERLQDSDHEARGRRGGDHRAVRRHRRRASRPTPQPGERVLDVPDMDSSQHRARAAG